jgi:hypothetical protein
VYQWTSFCPGIDSLRYTTNKTVRPTSRQESHRSDWSMYPGCLVYCGAAYLDAAANSMKVVYVTQYIVQHARDSRFEHRFSRSSARRVVNFGIEASSCSITEVIVTGRSRGSFTMVLFFVREPSNPVSCLFWSKVRPLSGFVWITSLRANRLQHSGQETGLGPQRAGVESAKRSGVRMYGPGTGTCPSQPERVLPSPSTCRRTSSEWTAGVFGFESGERKARWRCYTEQVSLVSRIGGRAEQKGPTGAANVPFPFGLRRTR